MYVHIQYVYNVMSQFISLLFPLSSFSASLTPPSLSPSLPPYRLDAGTFSTMGVGTGFSIAAALYTSSRPLVSCCKPQRRHTGTVRG